MEITSALLKKFREKANEALKSVGEELGISVEVHGNISFTRDGQEANAKLKLLAISVGDDGQEAIHDPEAEEFKRFATIYGFKPEDLGRRFASRGKLFEITGIKRTRKKYPVSAREVGTNKTYKFMATDVKRLMIV